MLAYTAGGHFDARANEEIDKLMTRLLSPAGLERRVCLLDNVKTLRFSWADLEGLITTDTISGRQLYVGEGRRPNTLTWFITLNNASLSKDMAQRCVIIRVKRPTFDPSWRENTLRFIDEHRWSLVGDILAQLSGPKPELARYSRWGAWEQEVLACVPRADVCQVVIVKRQAEVDGDQEDSDLVRGAFVAALRTNLHDPDTQVVFIPSSEAARIVNEATGECRPTQRATSYLDPGHPGAAQEQLERRCPLLPAPRHCQPRPIRRPCCSAPWVRRRRGGVERVPCGGKVRNIAPNATNASPPLYPVDNRNAGVGT
jgi:hypothetical protein